MKKYKEQYMNESIDQKWSFDEFKKFLDLRKEIEEKEKYISIKLREYLAFNKILPGELLRFIDDYKRIYEEPTEMFTVIDYHFDGSILIVDLSWCDGDEYANIFLHKKEIEDFIYFMNDPNIYKNAKKYNL